MSTTMRHTLRILQAAKHSQTGLRLKTTDSKILTSVYKDIGYNFSNVNDFVWQNLDRWPDKTATVCALTGHGYTYAQTHRMSVTFAASLHKKLKLRSDDKVAIILPNIPEYPVTVLGVLQAGCVASMMNPVYTPYELQKQLSLVDCKAIISSKLSYKNIKQALNAMEVSVPIILIDNDELPEGTIKFAELAEDFNINTDCLKSVERTSKDLAILPFSSGTTGFPKAVALTHGSVVALNEMIADPNVIVIEETTATHQAVLPAILPFFHIFGFNALMMNQMMLGCKLVTLPYFKPELFLQTLVQYKASVLFIVPPMVVFLGKHPAVKPDHLKSVYGIVCGAASLSESDAAAVLAKNESAETKKAYTYNQFQHYTATFATSLLKKIGLKPGDVVAVMLPNCPEFPVVAFGTLQAGCVLTPINPIYKEYEINQQVTLTEPKVIITIPECYDNIVKALKNSKQNIKIVFIDNPKKAVPNDVIRYSEIAENGEVDYGLLDKIERKPDDVAIIPFSSGTTGLPKGVEISHKNLLSAMECMSSNDTCFPNLTQGNTQDILPCFLPFFHIYGLVISLLGHLTLGCKLITMSKFSASLYMDLLKAQPMNLLYIVPPVAILLGKHPDVTEEHFRNVRHIVCGAAPLAASDVDVIREKSKRDIEFNQGFGATETTSLGTSTFKNTKNVDYSACGVPMAGVSLKFIDPATGAPVPIGHSGEMCIKSPMIMKGYLKNPQATADTMSEDGFFKTGDLGHYKPGVGLFITDRIKELIKVKGMQVAPAELESILRSHPSVQDAAVIGIPHEFYGEAPKAFIIRKPGLATTEEELQDFVANQVAGYKKIEQVMFVQDIPKTPSGKILRKDLKKIYA